MNILHRSETYCGWGCKGYETRKEAEAIKAKVEASTGKMPGLIKLDVNILIDNNTGRFFIHDSSSYDEDERRRLTRQPAGLRLNPA